VQRMVQAVVGKWPDKPERATPSQHLAKSWRVAQGLLRYFVRSWFARDQRLLPGMSRLRIWLCAV
jgi:hypothetical protein